MFPFRKSSFTDPFYSEAISKVLKSRQRYNLRPAKGAFAAVTFQVAPANYLSQGCGFALGLCFE